MGRGTEKLRRSRVFGGSAWLEAVVFGVLRRLGRAFPWERWTERNDFLDTVLDHAGTLEGRGDRVVVEQDLPRLGGRLRAELRPGTSDLPTWLQVAGLEEYFDAVRLLRDHAGAPVRTVVDAGANVGLAARYLALAFPDCRVLALEPDPANFRVLADNVADLGDRVRAVQAAFWPVDEPLSLDPEPFRGGREWARTVRPSEDAATARVAVVTPADAEARLGGEGIDLLKMDIEGAEAAFFADAGRRRDLLGRVGAIALEVHGERMDPHDVVRALDEAGFLVYPGREILIGVRRRG